jgi:hypothetical protein
MNGGESLFSSSAGSVAAIALVLAALALAGVVLLLARQQRLLGQYQHLMTGTSGGNLEAALHDHVTEVRTAGNQAKKADELSRHLERASRLHLQHVGLLRFNPFRDTGGDQSFALAIADDHGRGVVISSLHARDVTRAYAKPLIDWESTYALTEEEEQAIALARQRESAETDSSVESDDPDRTGLEG